MALAYSRWRNISVNIPIINMISLAFLFVGIDAIAQDIKNVDPGYLGSTNVLHSNVEIKLCLDK